MDLNNIAQFLVIGGVVQPAWKQLSAQIIAGLVIAVTAGAVGGYVAVKINDAVQDSEISQLQKTQSLIAEHLRQHETNGSIHYYHRQQ